jgi:predicted acylesterase/phospholipase RssA
MTAVQMTCALPILVTPVCMDDKCFIDGGMSTNYPLNYCIKSGKNPDEILGFKNKYSDEKSCINSDSTILDFLLSFLFKAVFSINTDNTQPNIKYEVICDVQQLNFNVLRSSLSNIESLIARLNEQSDELREKLNALIPPIEETHAIVKVTENKLDNAEFKLY